MPWLSLGGPWGLTLEHSLALRHPPHHEASEGQPSAATLLAKLELKGSIVWW